METTNKTQLAKTKQPKVGRSAQAIMRKLYPPHGIRPETQAYVDECDARGLRPMARI